MENQINIGNQNSQQIGQKPDNNITGKEESPKKTHWKIIVLLSILLVVTLVGLTTRIIRTRKAKVRDISIPVPTSSISTTKTNIVSSPTPPITLLLTCDDRKLPNLSFIKSLDDKNEAWKITNGQKNLQNTWSSNEKEDITGLWVATSPKELVIDKSYYSVKGYASLFLNDSQKTPIYGTTENEIIETIIYSSKEKSGTDLIYFSVLQGKPTPDTHYQINIFKFDIDNKQKSLIASFSSKDYFGNEKPGLSAVEAGGRFLITNQTSLMGGRGGCGADMAKFYDITTQKFLATTNPGKIDCGKEYIFKPNSSEFVLVTGPILVMDSPQKDAKIQIFKGRFENNSTQEEKELLREFSIEDYGAIYEIYEVNFAKEELYAKVRNPHTENSSYNIVIIPFNQQKLVEKMFSFQGYNYEIRARAFSSNQGILVSNLFLNKQGSIQNYEVDNWTGGVLIAINFNDNCMQEIDRVERKAWNNFWEGYPEVRLDLQ